MSRRKTTIQVDEEEPALPEQTAQRCSLAKLTRVLTRHLEAHSRRAKSIGAGRSGRGDLSERAEELLYG